MSLLLEALKKAEKAKEEAQRRASSEQAGAQAPASLQLQAEDPPPVGARHVVRRSELPEISQGLEILSDDISPKPAAAEASMQNPRSTSKAASSAQAAPRPAAGADASLQRAAARKVFEAKFKESNPRMPFYIVMGVLGVFALGTVGYFWYQLRPPAPLVNANPKPSAEQIPVAGATPAPASGNSANAGSAAGLPSAGAIQGLPSTPAPSAPTAAPPPPPGGSARAGDRVVAAKPAPRADASSPTQPALPGPRAAATPRSATRAETGNAGRVTAARPEAQLHPKVESAYAAYLAGDVATARSDYQQALRDDPSNRDALLGLAAADVRSGRFEAAEAAYVRLLHIDPRDAHAQAGLIALRSGRVDPIAAESRVKSLLAADPGAHVLYFTLGNQLAQQERWAEAQQQYFKAFIAEPDNADFAYNLAVSLDHLRQAKLALEYYQRALALAAKRGASFDAAATRQRIEQLRR